MCVGGRGDDAVSERRVGRACLAAALAEAPILRLSAGIRWLSKRGVLVCECVGCLCVQGTTRASQSVRVMIGEISSLFLLGCCSSSPSSRTQDQQIQQPHRIQIDPIV